jgi:hypothetical protein
MFYQEEGAGALILSKLSASTPGLEFDSSSPLSLLLDAAASYNEGEGLVIFKEFEIRYVIKVRT